MKRLVLVGLPETGKTTFLAALFHVLEADEGDCAFRISRLPDEMDQLNSYRETWKRCQELPRTPGASALEASFEIESDTQSFTLSLPDNTGETFVQLLEDRKWDSKLANQIEEADGIVLFVHSQKITQPVRLDDIHASAEELAGEPGAEAPTRAADPVFEYRRSPTQSLLVDLLQVLAEKAKAPLRLAVVISAWDLVPASMRSPRNLLKKGYPLLHQYLETNSDIFKVEVRGLSAQGGKLPQDAEKLKRLKVSDRVTLVSEDTQTHDLTKLLEWFYEQ